MPRPARLNDLGEAAGMRRVFPELPLVCGLKATIGHTLGACGVNELALFAAALQAGFMPGTPGFEDEDPALQIRPSTAASPAQAGAYVLNYFGFGGHNSALLLDWQP